jgi:hypothetical protein
LADGLLVDGETGRRVDLGAKPAAFRRAAQTDAGDNQTEFGRQEAAPIDQFRLGRESADIDRMARSVPWTPRRGVVVKGDRLVDSTSNL